MCVCVCVKLGVEKSGEYMLSSEARGREHIHVPWFEFVRTLSRVPGLQAREVHLGRQEVGRVVHLEVHLGLDGVHGGGLLQAEVGLQREPCVGEGKRP